MNPRMLLSFDLNHRMAEHMNMDRFIAEQNAYFARSYEQFALFGGPCVYLHAECQACKGLRPRRVHQMLAISRLLEVRPFAFFLRS